VREDLNKTALRRMVVLDPIKLVITNYPEGQTEVLHGENNPELEDNGGYRDLHFGRELWIEAEVRLYDRLFQVENPSNEEGDFKTYLNPNSLEIIQGAKIEQSLSEAKPGEQFQFIRKGYFTLDSKYASEGKLVFNRTVTLKDAWSKEVKK